MLGKLFKYEMKATRRTFLPIYLAIMLLALVNAFFITDQNVSFDSITDIQAISLTVYFFLLVAMSVFFLIVLIQRFYRNLLGDEGYLMFTLPVKTPQLIISKVLTSFVWLLAGSVVALCSLGLVMVFDIPWDMVIREFPAALDQLWKTILAVAEYFQMPAWLFTTEVIVSAVIDAIAVILMIYASIAMGQLFPKARKLAAFGSFIVLLVFVQVLSMVLPLDSSSGMGYIYNMFQPASMLSHGSNAFLHWSLVGSLIQGAVFYFITHIILSKRLNLE